MNVSTCIRFGTMLVLAAEVLCAAHEAAATETCGGNGGSTFPGSTLYSAPTESWCTASFFVVDGPGAGLLGQDQSTTTTSGTYGILGTSYYNTAVFGEAVTSGIGVQGASASGYGGTFTSPGTGTAGVNAALYGDATGTGGTGVLGTGYGYSCAVRPREGTPASGGRRGPR